MNDSLFKQFVHRVPAPSEAKEVDIDEMDDLGSFGYLRGVRDRALMLELRLKDCTIKALGYSWLERAEFDPSDGFSLYFGAHLVRIEGRNLDIEVRPNVRLLDGIIRHRVPWIRESSEVEAMKAVSESFVIEAISVK